MSYVFTIKLPSHLRYRLETAAQSRGISKGAVVREVLEKSLKDETSSRERIERITRMMMQGKRIKTKKIDWEEIRKKASAGATPGLTPEEEVRLHRRRWL